MGCRSARSRHKGEAPALDVRSRWQRFPESRASNLSQILQRGYPAEARHKPPLKRLPRSRLGSVERDVPAELGIGQLWIRAARSVPLVMDDKVGLVCSLKRLAFHSRKCFQRTLGALNQLAPRRSQLSSGSCVPRHAGNKIRQRPKGQTARGAGQLLFRSRPTG